MLTNMTSQLKHNVHLRLFNTDILLSYLNNFKYDGKYDNITQTMVNTHRYTIKYDDKYDNITWAMVNAHRYAIK